MHHYFVIVIFTCCQFISMRPGINLSMQKKDPSTKCKNTRLPNAILLLNAGTPLKSSNAVQKAFVKPLSSEQVKPVQIYLVLATCVSKIRDVMAYMRFTFLSVKN